MNKIKSAIASKNFLEQIILFIITGLTYLIFVSRFGYFYDDWYLMYAAGANGPSVFWDIFAIDRPLRAIVMIPTYSLFGANPLYYNLTAFFFRFMSGIGFLWILRLVWKDENRLTFFMTLLWVLYPGFLSQPNAIDYLCHITGLVAGMFSIGLTIKAVQSKKLQNKFTFYILSILLGWFYLGQIEWYIGLEFLRFGCLIILAFREDGKFWDKFILFFKTSLIPLVIPSMFLGWRLFYFESERGATDVDLQLGDVLSEPFVFVTKVFSTLWDDTLDVLIRAWITPLLRLKFGLSKTDWLLGLGIVLLIITLLWVAHKYISENKKNGRNQKWRWEVFLLGLGILIAGLMPVILVGRSVDFKSFSRYTLIASIGTALILPLIVSFISNLKLQDIIFSILIGIASLTHYANGFVKASETQSTQNFWWQVSWRIPQLGVGTTLITHYAVAAEEDYFTWGPANLIYHPESEHEKYVQPAIYALLLDENTIEKVFAREGQDYSERRSIRTYPNYRNILILTQPRPESCVQVIDLRQVELSSYEDERVKQIASYSEADQIELSDTFQTPPLIPFGIEPEHGWCYYYQKASYARQVGDWEQVSVLGDAVFNLELQAQDQIEWMPFIQAYAYSENISRLQEIASMMSKDKLAFQQACQILLTMQIESSIKSQADRLFCIQ